MKRQNLTASFALLLLLTVPQSALATMPAGSASASAPPSPPPSQDSAAIDPTQAPSTDPAAAAQTPKSQPQIVVGADLLNVGLYRSDSDFDRTAPLYNERGQSVGGMATIFRPRFTMLADDNLRLFYEAELGINFWSRHNPDQQNASQPDALALKHRQIYAEGEFLNKSVGFRTGYQFVRDPTALFLGHWIGAANAWYSWSKGNRVSLLFGQLPNQTIDGLNARQTNFSRDLFVFGPRIDLAISKDFALSGAITNLYDRSVVGHTRFISAPSLHIEAQAGSLSGFIDGVMQFGQIQDAALGGNPQNILAWAAQAHGTYRSPAASFDLNALILSSDDSKEGNKNNGSFAYSSRSRSATIILTEDETRNWYDQLDRQMASYRGGFWEHRAGLVVTDIKSTLHVSEVFHPALIVGAGSVLQPQNALGNRFVGIETDINLEFRASKNLSANLIGGALFAGKAAGALVNSIDRYSASPIYMAEAALRATY